METFVIIILVITAVVLILWSIGVNDSTDTISQETKKAVEANWSIIMGQLNLTATNRLANTVLEYCINDKKIEILDILNRANFIKQLNKLENIDEAIDDKIIKINSDGSYNIDQATYNWIIEKFTFPNKNVPALLSDILKSINSLRSRNYNFNYVYFPDNDGIKEINKIIEALKNKTKGTY